MPEAMLWLCEASLKRPGHLPQPTQQEWVVAYTEHSQACLGEWGMCAMVPGSVSFAIHASAGSFCGSTYMALAAGSTSPLCLVSSRIPYWFWSAAIACPSVRVEPYACDTGLGWLPPLLWEVAGPMLGRHFHLDFTQIVGSTPAAHRTHSSAWLHSRAS